MVGARLGSGTHTDDTQMIALAETLLERSQIDAVALGRASVAAHDPRRGHGPGAAGAARLPSHRMDDATLRRRLWRGLAHQQALFGSHMPGAQAVTGDGWTASVVPGAPESSMLNAAVAERAEAVVPGLSELSALFCTRDVRWGIWVDSGAREVDLALEDSGFEVATACVEMGAALSELDLGDGGPAEPAELALVGAVNDDVYGLTDRRLEIHFGALPSEAVRGYRVDRSGRAACVLAVADHDDDAGVLFVATRADSRRRALARELMQGALREARARGRTTTSLLSTAMGEPLYARLGYRRLGEARLWEWRGRR